MTSQSDARHCARLAAVQALYQMEMNGAGAEEVAQEFIEHRLAEFPVAPDQDFFSAILNGVPQHQVEIDRAIASALSERWRLERVIPFFARYCAVPCSNLWPALMFPPRW